jgi:O-antigen/teichoic acid export membrane protein
MQPGQDNDPSDVRERDATTRQLLARFASLLTGSVVVRATAFAASVVVIRLVGPSEFGAFTVGLTLAVLFALCVNPGMDDLLVRQVARAQERHVGWLIGDVILLRSPAVPLGLVGGALADTFIHTGGLYLCLGAYGTAHAYLLLICAVLRARGHMHAQAVLLSAHMTTIAVASIVGCLLTQSVVLVAAVYAIATASAVAVGYLLILRIGIRPQYAWRVSAWTHLARASLSFGVTLVGVLLLDRQALIWLALLRDQTDAGWFSSVYNLVLALTNVPMMAAAVALPHMARLARNNPAELRRVAAHMLRFTLMMGIVLAAALHFLAGPVVLYLFGPAYEASASVLRVIAFSVPPFFVTFVLISILEAVDRQRSCAVAVLQALAAASPVAVLAVWAFGLEGAAVGYVAAHVVLATLLAWRTLHLLAATSMRHGLRAPLAPGTGVTHG